MTEKMNMYGSGAAENHFLSMDTVTWYDGEPSDNSGSANCVEMYTLNGRWNEKRCTSHHPYICEHSLGKMYHLFYFHLLL